ncbi:MAG: ABC transporter transmembrane domain-containing protein, partial [Alphaproteobacteria bacterium]|nr:ABC transporter transmembrane domain-containing protein [Alphaproteobacteria bacterium]
SRQQDAARGGVRTFYNTSDTMMKSANPILKQALSACYSGFAAVVVFSLFINVLMLTAPLYMLQIFDRVIAARSEDTLLYLTLIAGVALLTLAALEMSRTRIMVGLGTWLDQRLSGTVLEGSIGKSVAAAGTPSIQGLRDLSTIRTFLTGSEMFPILDSPWTPIFIAAIFMMHPILGWLSLGGAIVLFGLAIANDLATRNLLRRSGGASFTALRQAESAVRNAHVIEAMGMMPNLVGRWHAKNTEMLDLQARASRRAGAITATSKFIRQCLQISVLGTGAWLMLGGEITAGIMIASSILMARALAPIEQAIGSWRSAIAARGAYERVRDQLATTRVRGAKITLPRPEGRLKVEGVTFFHPDGVAPTLGGVSFELEPG